MVPKIVILSKKDNVATAVQQLNKGEFVNVRIEDCSVDVILTQSIPFGHKFAFNDIEPGEPIIKYGEVIGLATRNIMKGQHVHVHNVEGLKGRGDKK